MKKTFTVNISGIVFNIDEDAYSVLNDYLQSIKKHFARTDGRDEIISDIESRIAEILSESITDTKQVISIEDIENVIKVIGLPNEFEIDEDEPSAKQRSSGRSGKSTKRLYRDPDNTMISGVCGGLGAYFHTDPVWFRLAFVILALAGVGSGILIYIVLWVVIPLASSTAEKLEMRGEKVDLSNIEKSIREEIDNLKDKFNEFTQEAKNTYKKKSTEHQNEIDNIGAVLLRILEVFGKIVLIFIGVILLLIGVSLVAAFGVAIFGIGDFFIFPGPKDFHIIPYDEIALLLFGNSVRGDFLLAGVLLFLGIPILMMIYGGSRLVFRFPKIRYIGVVALVLWIAGLIITAFYGTYLAREFKDDARDRKVLVINTQEEKPLYLRLGENEDARRIYRYAKYINIDDEGIYLLNDKKGGFYGEPRLRIRKSEDSTIKIRITYFAMGKNDFTAKERAENIVYNYEVNDTLIVFDRFFKMNGEKLWRGQQVWMTLEIPEGRQGGIGEDMSEILRNSWYHSRYSLSGNTFVMNDIGRLEKVGE